MVAVLVVSCDRWASRWATWRAIGASGSSDKAGLSRGLGGLEVRARNWRRHGYDSGDELIGGLLRRVRRTAAQARGGGGGGGPPARQPSLTSSLPLDLWRLPASGMDLPNVPTFPTVKWPSRRHTRNGIAMRELDERTHRRAKAAHLLLPSLRMARATCAARDIHVRLAPMWCCGHKLAPKQVNISIGCRLRQAPKERAHKSHHEPLPLSTACRP